MMFTASDEPFCHEVVQEMSISRICSSSRGQRNGLITLAACRPGEKMTIKEITGVREMRARLGSMGFREGNPVEVITTSGEGMLILFCDGIRLALDRRTAQKIMVSFS